MISPRSRIAQLRTIQAGQHAGFSLEEIAQLLRGAQDGRAADELRELAERKLPDIEALIERAESYGLGGWRDDFWLRQQEGCPARTGGACSGRDASAITDVYDAGFVDHVNEQELRAP